jgi:hypothetical protein
MRKVSISSSMEYYFLITIVSEIWSWVVYTIMEFLLFRSSPYCHQCTNCIRTQTKQIRRGTILHIKSCIKDQIFDAIDGACSSKWILSNYIHILIFSDQLLNYLTALKWIMDKYYRIHYDRYPEFSYSFLPTGLSILPFYSLSWN